MPKRLSVFTNRTLAFAQSGTNEKIESRRISWSASLPTCSGNVWGRCASKLASGTNREKSLKRSEISPSLMLSYRRAKEQRSDCVVSHGRNSIRSEEHTSELQSPYDLVCRLLLEKK